MTEERMSRLIRLAKEDTMVHQLKLVDLQTIRDNKEVYIDFIIHKIKENVEEYINTWIVPKMDSLLDNSFDTIRVDMDFHMNVDPTYVVEEAWTLRDDKIKNLLDD